MRTYNVELKFSIDAKNLSSASKKYAPIIKAVRKVSTGDLETLCSALSPVIVRTDEGDRVKAYGRKPLDLVNAEGETLNDFEPEEEQEVRPPAKQRGRPKLDKPKKKGRKKKKKKETKEDKVQYWFCCEQCHYEQKCKRKPKINSETKRYCPKCKGGQLEVYTE